MRPSDICEWALAMLCIMLCKLNQAAQFLFVTVHRYGKVLESYYYNYKLLACKCSMYG